VTRLLGVRVNGIHAAVRELYVKTRVKPSYPLLPTV